MRKGEGRWREEDETGTKYRRRTAVGIKRRDGRRGGPTLFPVDWTARGSRRRCCGGHLAFRYPLSCRPAALRHHLSLPLLLICVSRVRVCVRHGLQCACRPPLCWSTLLYLTSSPTFILRSLRRMTRRGHAQYYDRIIILCAGTADFYAFVSRHRIGCAKMRGHGAGLGHYIYARYKFK